ncbi:hypothetical protein M0813_19518 [Anaeramoeba flamelloides]|uniref:Uncharacterized protein n=1 Tax=Anaeramoeba flamelloides TaxID=1746091 RepID=A0ABQ8YP42_9EUKA|nr:hypothetical protein M0813_19518 [Anaeramoeba flamelloides]
MDNQVNGIDVLVSMYVSFQNKLAKSISSLFMASKSLLAISFINKTKDEHLQELDFGLWCNFPRSLPFYSQFLKEYREVGKNCLSHAIQVILKSLPQLSGTAQMMNSQEASTNTTGRSFSGLNQTSRKPRKSNLRKGSRIHLQKNSLSDGFTNHLNRLKSANIFSSFNTYSVPISNSDYQQSGENVQISIPTSDFEFDSFLQKLYGFILCSGHYEIAVSVCEIFIVDVISVLLENYENTTKFILDYEKNMSKLNPDTVVLLQEFAWSNFVHKKPK